MAPSNKSSDLLICYEISKNEIERISLALKTINKV